MEEARAELQRWMQNATDEWTEDEVMAEDYQSPSTVAVCVDIDQPHFVALRRAYADKMFHCYWKVI